MNSLSFKLLLGLALGIQPAHAYFLDYFKAQHAGEIGELALGFGKQFTNVYSLDYMHGLVREETGGSTIETVALKNNFNLHKHEFNWSYVDIYAGVGVYHVVGLRYQASRHNSYPDDYYRLGSIRGLFYLGAKGSLEEESQHQAYFESGINDVWIGNYFNNPETVNFFEHVSLALGYAFLF